MCNLLIEQANSDLFNKSITDLSSLSSTGIFYKRTISGTTGSLPWQAVRLPGELLAEAGLSPFAGITDEPGSDDVLIVVRASDEAHAVAALDRGEALLLSNT